MGDPSTQRVKDLRVEITDASDSSQNARRDIPDQSNDLESLISDYREDFYIDDCH